MRSLIRWAFGIALALAATGQLKSATLKLAEMAIRSQHHQISYLKFSQMLTGTAAPSNERRQRFAKRRVDTGQKP
jgi:hypothetical protein